MKHAKTYSEITDTMRATAYAHLSPSVRRPRHRAHRRDMALVAGALDVGLDLTNTAACRSEVRGAIEGISGTLAGRLLRNCRSEVCAHHHPEAYASHMAKHAPESFSDSVLAGRMMSDW